MWYATGSSIWNGNCDDANENDDCDYVSENGGCDCENENDDYAAYDGHLDCNCDAWNYDRKIQNGEGYAFSRHASFRFVLLWSSFRMMYLIHNVYIIQVLS